MFIKKLNRQSSKTLIDIIIKQREALEIADRLLNEFVPESCDVYIKEWDIALQTTDKMLEEL